MTGNFSDTTFIVDYIATSFELSALKNVNFIPKHKSLKNFKTELKPNIFKVQYDLEGAIDGHLRLVLTKQRIY